MSSTKIPQTELLILRIENMIRTRYQASAIFLVDGKHRAEIIASSGPGALDLRKMLSS